MPGSPRRNTAPVVAVDARSLNGRRTGIGMFTAAVVERWVAAGHDVRLLTDADTPDASLPTAPVRVGAPFHLRAAGLARRHRWRYYSPDSLIVPTLLGSAAVATVHDLAPLLHPGTQTLRVRLAYRSLLRLGTRRARAVVVPSEATATDLRRLSPAARVHVVGEGPRSFPPPDPLPAAVRPPYLLFIGTLEPRKHPAELAEAFLAAAPAPWQLVFAGGRGWLDEGAWRRLQAAAADPRVVLLDYVEDAVLNGLFAGAGALAYPSSYEGFGLPVLEAMAAGVPVLATTAAALRELAADAALLVDLAGPDPYGAGLRSAIGELLGDDALRARLADAGRRRATSYDWVATAEAIWRVVTG